MSLLFLTQVSFEEGKQKNLYFWEGAFPLMCSQDIVTVSAGKWCGLAPQQQLIGEFVERGRQEKNPSSPQLFTVTVGN